MDESILYLASASPRRKQLLQQIGLSPVQFAVDIDESVHSNELPVEYVRRMSKQKAIAAHDYLVNLKTNVPKSGIIIAADTTVVLDEHILTKPRDYADFVQMMKGLSGMVHRVLTSVSVCQFSLEQSVGASSSDMKTAVCETQVQFKVLTDREIDRYWDTGEPADKAGGYGIQGKGALFVESINGSYSNVVGLPLYDTTKLLESVNYDLWLPSNMSTSMGHG